LVRKGKKGKGFSRKKQVRNSHIGEKWRGSAAEGELSADKKRGE